MSIEWYKLEDRRERLRPLSFIIGGRGIGKTYSTIDYILRQREPFLYLRNTDVQMSESATDFGNPFKRWCLDHGRDVRIRAEGKHYRIIDFGADDRPTIGYAAALSTFGNLRGVDLSDVKTVMFDEFVERRTLSFPQFETFANLYETVNRNRELLGERPLQVFLLSNSQALNNPILAGYGVIPIIEQMIRERKEEYVGPDLYINLPKSAVSSAKADTVNYRLTQGSQYYQEALENTFAYDSFANIRKRPLMEYIPVATMDDWGLWQHKANGRYYICRSISNQVPAYNTRDSLPAFLHRYGLTLRLADQDGKIDFSEFLLKVKLSDVLQ